MGNLTYILSFFLKKPGAFSQIVKNQDKRVEIILNKNNTAKENLKKVTNANESDSSLRNHLLMTKSELTKCLGKVLE